MCMLAYNMKPASKFGTDDRMEPGMSPLYLLDIGSLNRSHPLIEHEFIWRIGHELTGRMVLFAQSVGKAL
jgi:hypothetical protein